MDGTIFNVESWGQVGSANLYAFVPFADFKLPEDLEVSESTAGKFQNPTSDKKPERITRIK